MSSPAIVSGERSDTPAAGPAEKVVAILQSSYIPWKGYFDIIAAVDEFLIFDDVQFTRRDWRNRNKILVGGAPKWLTIPVQSKGKYHAPINEIEVADPHWAEEHWQTIRHAYAKAPFFGQYREAFEQTYRRAAALSRLTDINELFLRTIVTALALPAAIRRTDDVRRVADNPTGRLVEICAARGATLYVSGPAAKDYLEPGLFAAARIELRFADYSGYPTYDQGSGAFEHGVSMLDTLFRCGPDARAQLKSPRGRKHFLVAG